MVRLQLHPGKSMLTLTGSVLMEAKFQKCWPECSGGEPSWFNGGRPAF
jgi:hypothetical protein